MRRHTLLRTNAVSTVYILHENDDWMDPFCYALDKLNVPYVLWHLGGGGYVDLNAAPPAGVFWNRMSASSHTRGHVYAPEFASAIIEWLEDNNCVVVNGSRALALELSKVRQNTALRRAGIRTPRTVAVAGSGVLLRERLALAAREYFPATEFITKHNRAGRGLGVELFKSVAAFERRLGVMWTGSEYAHADAATTAAAGDDAMTTAASAFVDDSRDGVYLLQQKITSPGNFIVRAEFVGGTFVYAVRVDTSKGFLLCPADACESDSLACPADSNNDAAATISATATGSGDVDTLVAASGEPPTFCIAPQYTRAEFAAHEAFLRANAIGIAGIEFITDADGVRYTYDVNTNTNYNSIAEHEAFGCSKAPDTIARYLQSLLTAVVESTASTAAATAAAAATAQ